MGYWAIPYNRTPPVDEQFGKSTPLDGHGVPQVLVTSTSGFIATHVIYQLLQQGRVRVRGTVRSIANTITNSRYSFEKH